MPEPALSRACAESRPGGSEDNCLILTSTLADAALWPRRRINLACPATDVAVGMHQAALGRRCLAGWLGCVKPTTGWHPGLRGDALILISARRQKKARRGAGLETSHVKETRRTWVARGQLAGWPQANRVQMMCSRSLVTPSTSQQATKQTSLMDEQTAVYRQVEASDVAVVFGHQKGDRTGDLFRFAHTTHRHGGNDSLTHIVTHG